jgi:hypothetical protein
MDQRVAPWEHPAQGCHHPARGIVSAAWLDLALLEERQLFPKKQIFRGERTAGMCRKNSQSDQVKDNQ